jgi:hypothetical protein
MILAPFGGASRLVSVVMPPSLHPETMKTGSGWAILAGDASPDKVGISLVL